MLIFSSAELCEGNITMGARQDFTGSNFGELTKLSIVIKKDGAGSRIRTYALTLEGSHSATELFPLIRFNEKRPWYEHELYRYGDVCFMEG